MNCTNVFLYFKVVVLKSGDLTEAEAKHVEKQAAVKPREATDEKIFFKKPKKTTAENNDTEKKSERLKKTSISKKVKNKSLLSFDEDVEENDDS